MRLLRIEIENFGKLQGYALELREGLNTVCEENGFGKSTLAAFIKAMFYGLPASTKRNLDKNERKKYAPWQGGVYGGSLEFECERGCFRIERFFGAKEANDEFQLFDLSTNKPSSAYSADVGIELFGIDAEGFARSAFLAQSGIDDDRENVSVTAKLTGLLEDVNDMGSYDVAMEILDKRRKFYEVKGGRGQVSDLNNTLAEKRRELDHLNGLLADQTILEDQLAQIREQKNSEERELPQLRERLRLSELRSAHLAERERANARIAQAEAQQDQILNAFRNREIPTAEALSNAQRQLKEYRIEQSKLQALRLSPEESDALGRLRQRYAGSRPTPEVLSELHHAMCKESELEAAMQAIPSPRVSEDQKRFEGRGIPSPEDLNRLQRDLEQIDGLDRKIQIAADAPGTTVREKVMLTAAITLWSVSACNLAASFLFHALQAILWSFCGLSAAIGTLLFLISRRKSAASRAEAIQGLQAQRQMLAEKVGAILKQYGFLPDRGDLRSGVQQLTAAAQRAEADLQAQRAYALRRRELMQSATAQRQNMQALFAACGVQQIPADPRQALLRIHTDLREWDTLEQKAQALKQRANLLQADLEQRQNAISEFLNRLISKEHTQPEARLEQMEQLCRSYAINQATILRQRQELSEREEQYRQSVPSELPPDEDLKRQEQERNQRLENLRREESDLLRRLNQCADQTQRIPQLEDELSHLSLEAATAEHHLNLLRKTAQFLTESKEALSTRYLGGMQERFLHFLQLAETKNVRDASMDTSFSVSVREGGKNREIESFSRGSRDMLQFCARLALTSAMFAEGERPFLLLDDPFVNLDEAHFASVKGLLDRLSEEFQILYLVCHRDRC